jgi:phosphate acetyltransferase
MNESLLVAGSVWSATKGHHRAAPWQVLSVPQMSIPETVPVGQITGGLLDGPLVFDNAIDPTAARIKGIKSEVASRTQILVVPDLEAGNMFAKNLSFLAHTDAAGIVLGARVPIILTSPAGSVPTRMASCAVAVLYAEARCRTATLQAT